MNRFTDKITWKFIDSLGSLKFSKTSYYYIVIIPVLIKFTDDLESPLVFQFGDLSYSFVIELPFSWFAFYFGAISISIGSFLYMILCPELIKKYRDYGKFLESGESDFYLINMGDKYISKNSVLHDFKNEFHFIEELETTKNKNVTTNLLIGYKVNNRYLEMRKDIFSIIYNEVNLSKRRIRIITAFFYLTGFLAFLMVIIQNINFVIDRLI